MKNFQTFLLTLFIACMIAGASACGEDNGINNSSDKPSSRYLFQLDSFTINARDTGVVNNSNYREWVTEPDSNIFIEFDAEVSPNVQRDVKYAQITLMQNNAVNFFFQRYNDDINGHHAFAVTEAFDAVTFYIKIYNNYSLPAFIRLTNIKITRL